MTEDEEFQAWRKAHLQACGECRSRLFVWYLREYGVEPIPSHRTDDDDDSRTTP